MKTVSECWNAVRRATKDAAVGDALRRVLATPWGRLPPEAVRVDSTVLAGEYLDFLEAQIAACPTGKWRRVLARRFEALAPHRRKRLVGFTVLSGRRWFWAKVEARTGRVAYWELA